MKGAGIILLRAFLAAIEEYLNKHKKCKDLLQ